MEELRPLAQEQDRQRRPEQRHQVEERPGPVRPDQFDAADEEQIGERRGEHDDIGECREGRRSSVMSRRSIFPQEDRRQHQRAEPDRE